jgi:putative ABC transport system substrate-binding protein
VIARRRLLAMLACGATAVRSGRAGAQHSNPQRLIGVLMSFSPGDTEDRLRVRAFDDTLRQLGLIAAHNLRVEYRWAHGDGGRAKAAAEDLVALGAHVLLATSTLTLTALRDATRTVPIVFVNVTDPVGQGAVQSLAHPGGNVTGFSNYEFLLGGKWLELLREVSPGMKRVAVMQRSGHPAWGGWLTAIEAAARPLGLELVAIRSSEPAEFEPALEDLARQGEGGLIVLPDPALGVHRDRIIALAASHRLPAVYSRRLWPDAGGLMSAGIDGIDQYKQAAGYVDRILKGERAERLPVQQPTKLELIVNLKTAHALGLTVPPSLLIRADEVIE